MAHVSEQTGIYSQVIAKAALIAAGFEVGETETAEVYDFIAKEPSTNKWSTFQCKTIRKRGDRKNQMVVYAKNGQGKLYSKSDVDYIIGVLAENGEQPRVFYFENREIGEYWISERLVKERWIELPISLDRNALKKRASEGVINDVLL